FRWVRFAIGDGLLNGLDRELIVLSDFLRAPRFCANMPTVKHTRADAPTLDEQFLVLRLGVRGQVFPGGSRLFVHAQIVPSKSFRRKAVLMRSVAKGKHVVVRM